MKLTICGKRCGCGSALQYDVALIAEEDLPASTISRVCTERFLLRIIEEPEHTLFWQHFVYIVLTHVVGLYLDGRQVGFARAVDCDAAGFAYIADVYVLAAHRGRGLGAELVREIVENGPLADSRFVLHTRDAQALYSRFGFVPSERALERPARTRRGTGES